MKLKLTATLGCLMLCCALYAQWLPPVTFPANTNVCDAAAWKLVFYDEFNGNTLSNKWTTVVKYDEAYKWIPGGNGDWYIQVAEHGNHDGARRSAGPSIFKDENIIVSNGTCKMLQIYDPNSSWTVKDSTRPNYPDTTQYADFSTAMIRLPQEDANRMRKGYSSGKFQARMKMPNFDGAWPAFWMWYGRGGINEIDITEAWAGSGLHPVHFNTVAWWPDPNPNNNPYHLPGDAHMNNIYPYQSWHNYLLRSVPGKKYLNKGDWHTYTCAWDKASISYQLDNELPNTIWKYYRRKTVTKWWGAIPVQHSITIGSGCIPDGSANSWAVTYGYPWNNDTANCDVRISSAYTSRAGKYRNIYGNSRHLLGTFEVDFVKIWQRHPEKDNHTEICAASTYPATPVISGPSEVCGQVAYTVSPAVTGGTWSSFNNDILHISNPTASGVDVAKDAGPAFNQGWVAYSYGNGIPECPLISVYKRSLYCNQSTNWNVMVPTVLNNNGEGRFHFISDLYHKRDVGGSTTPVVTWNISINNGIDHYDENTAENFTLYGQYASSPSFQAQENQSYNLRWTMNVTDASGTHSRSGERNSKTRLLQQEDDKNTFYLNAYIDDQDLYDTTVYYGVASGMISEEESNDTLFVNELIEKVRAEALEPYIITDGMELMSKGVPNPDMPDNEGSLPELKSKLKVYPNPVQSNITIIADSRFADGQTILLNIYDLAGKLVKTGHLDYRKGNMTTYDLSDMADGNYILELQQGPVNDHIKIIKQKN